MKINNKLAALLILSTMSFATIVKADQIVIPVISKPAVLQEGTQRELSVAQIAELLPWAKDSKIFLADLLDSTQGLSNTDKLDRLVEGMKYVVGESAPKNSELLMRYTINRGLVINDILSKESSSAEVGSVDAKVRVLVSTIKMAIKYYETDMVTLSKKSPAPFVTFGLDYFNFLSELNKSIFDASAQYSIQRTSLEWLQWDLYRDLNNTSFAASIVKINNSLKVFPGKVSSDKQALSYVRQMKGLVQQLDLKEGAVRRNNNNDESTNFETANISQSGQTIVAIKKPTANGLKFSYLSNYNGTCKALGFEKGVEGSVSYERGSDSEAYMIYDENGVLQNATFSGHFLATITCINKSNNPLNEAVKINNPIIPGGNIDFSYNSNANTVCTTLGYSHGYQDSITAEKTSSPVVIASLGNNFSSGVSDGHKISSIVCNSTGKVRRTSIAVKNFDKPTLQGQSLHYTTNLTGVCKLLGYSYGVSDASRYERDTGLGLILDENGSVVSSVMNTHKLSNVICVK